MLRIIALLLVFSAADMHAQLRQAVLGECPLELGGRIESCRMAYRTFGTLNSTKTNAVLIPTWFASRADAWVPLLGPKGVVDTAGFFVVVVESLGAGSSSAPGNSETQRGALFPEITVGDMVQASYRLVREHLGLPELYAVVGISLGGMQAFEWGVRYPDYVRRVIPIHGAPRQAIYGRAMWELITRAAEDGARGAVPLDSTAITLARFFIVATTSPAAANRRADSTYAGFVSAQATELRGVDLYEWSRHGRAIIRHDVARRFGGNLTEAARHWRAKTFVVAATQDHCVDADPALAFARLVRADTLVVSGPSGHSTIFGDSAVKAAVREWLMR